MMYNYALFFHIVGALLLFAGLGIELTSLLNIKEANRHILIPKILKMNRVYGILTAFNNKLKKSRNIGLTANS